MRRSGFTLIELLVVIAIIAILAAIAFPVIARAKDNAYRNSDISNMNSIRSALQLYRVDQGAYPPALLGYVTLYTSTTNVVPANELKTFLYPKRIESIETFRPSRLRVSNIVTSAAVWPLQDPRSAGSAPVGDWNGDGSITSADDNACARQAYGPTDGNVQRRNPNGPGTIDALYYMVSGYDISTVPDQNGGKRVELHYAPFWTRWGLASDNGCSPSGSPGHANDDPRQLGYSEPPDSTVITWNSYYREYNNGVPDRG
ncbi:MAG TPA: prepilin-type N-terminal cleavage/methylation domain-containing protein, partial [Fimbriimonadaceae bacterium]|nr:prepilin-type N-terminal cleavage/methylation domain-containing protein [Fimbriimonadaceae bacterium]